MSHDEAHAGPALRRRTLLGAVGTLAGLPLAPGWARASVAGGLPELVAAARGSIVPVGLYSATDNPRFAFRGTGFAVGDGLHVVTNFHVLPEAGDAPGGPTMMALVPRGGGEHDPRMARVVGTDRVHDLALLRIDGEPLKPLTLASDALAPEGTAVALIGFPVGGVLGFSPVTHRGIVSSVTRIALPAPTAQRLDARAIARLREGAFDVYQLDATAYPGNSGGPVFDTATGAVIGVVNMVLVRGTRESALSQPTGISYAIPARWVRELLGTTR